MLYFFIGVAAMNVYALLLLLIRPKLFKTKLYKPMIKNMFLSIIAPLLIVAFTLLIEVAFLYFFGNILSATLVNVITILIAVIGIVSWLLMLPNSGYLITELNLNHRTIDLNEVPLYYDIIAVLVLAMSGVLNTLANVFIVEILIGTILSPSDVYSLLTTKSSMIIVSLLYILVTLGIYMGRYIRFNSWDILKPPQFIKKFLNHFKDKTNIKNMIVFVISHSIFFIIMHTVVIVPLFLR